MFGMSGSLAGLAGAIEALGDEDRSGWPGPARVDRAVGLVALWERLGAEVLRAIGDADRDRAWEGTGAVTAAGWLAAQAPLGRIEAVRLVRSARLVRDHERTGKALASGDLTCSHVEILTRAVGDGREHLYGEHEEALLEAAASIAPGPFAILARRWRYLADDRLATADAAAAQAHRYLHVSKTFGGSVIIDGLLAPDGGATLLAALAALDRPDPSNGPIPPRSPAQRRADALVSLAAQSLTHPEHPGRPPISIDVLVDADTLTGTPPAEPAAARADIARIGPVAPEMIRRLACDALIGTITRNGAHGALDAGRRHRLVTPAQRRALLARDQGCAFPGCDRPPDWCDAHHLQHWTHGGPTELDNLVLLCRPHHTACHEGNWTLQRSPDGHIVAVPP